MTVELLRYKFLLFMFFLACHFFFGQGQTNKLRIENHLNKAYSFYYTDKDSLRFYLDKVKVLALEKNDIETLCEAYNVDSWNAAFYADVNRMKLNIETLDSLTGIYKKDFEALPYKIYRTVQFLYTKGQYYDEIKEQHTSNDYFKKIISIYQKQTDSIISEEFFHLIKESYLYLAGSYADENRFAEAEEYYKKNLRLIEQKSNNKFFKYSTLMKLADLNRSKKDFKKSNEYILKCMPYYENLIKKGNNRVIVGYQQLVENHIDLEQLDSAKFYLYSLKNEFTEDHSMFDRYYKVSSKIFEAEDNYEKALFLLNQNLDFISHKWSDRLHPEIAESYSLIAQLHQKFDQPKRAVKSYNLALNQFSENSINSNINKTLIFKILKNKSSTLNVLKEYKNTLKIVKQATTILDSLKPSFTTHKDKLFLIEDAYPLFENGLEAAYNLYKNTKDDNYIDKAFAYSEKSKSVLLMEALLSTQATNFANIPEDLVFREKQLRAKKNNLEKRIKKKSSIKLEDELFQVNQDYKNLIKNFEINYKKYFNLKYNTKVSRIKILQESLTDDQAMISYFYGDNAIYVITVGKEYKSLHKIEVPGSLEKNIKEVYKLFSDSQSDITLLADKTNLIYNLILKPVIQNIKQEHLIIIPDGRLNYIPFESLNTSDVSTRYLIQDKSISYINSATLLTHLDHKQNNTQAIAFAPSFKGVEEVSVNRNKLLPLIYNTKEAASVLNHFKGDLYQDNDATLQNFKSNMSDFNVIHLATHAFFNDMNPEYSYLAFSDRYDENLLYVSDIYNTQVNANMVTLSACETGIGTLKKGEGFLSLSRSFFYAGASSITSTLWKVNDGSSSELMDLFYSNLSKGFSKNEALRKAKIDFISKYKDIKFSHPYYWSGFIVSGNTDPLVSNNGWIWILIVAVLFVGLLSAFALKKRSEIST